MGVAFGKAILYRCFFLCLPLTPITHILEEATLVGLLGKLWG
jgi:hypothetical protein